jgi:hypothetical protein
LKRKMETEEHGGGGGALFNDAVNLDDYL